MTGKNQEHHYFRSIIVVTFSHQSIFSSVHLTFLNFQPAILKHPNVLFEQLPHIVDHLEITQLELFKLLYWNVK